MKFRFTRRHKARLRFQLTQVCRQIRMEFRGLYFVKVPKWVDLWDVDAYIAAFHVDNVPAPDNVTVDMLGLASKNARTCDFLSLKSFPVFRTVYAISITAYVAVRVPHLSVWGQFLHDAQRRLEPLNGRLLVGCSCRSPFTGRTKRSWCWSSGRIH
jgi:hypothetical protein